MTTMIEDSPRPFQAGWMTEAVNAGYSAGAVLNPWATPYLHRGGSGNKPGVVKRAEELRDANVGYWFDPMTHALQMPGVGDFRYYAEFDLWGGPRGDVTDAAYRDEHVNRVFRIQKELKAPLLAPTLLLHTGLSNVSALALDLARASHNTAPEAAFAIAGSGSFWSSGTDLDAHVGSLLSLQPQGWFLTFTHPGGDLPPAFTAAEIAGVCRTVRALSEYAPVYISHGDIAALPAVAAGAFAVGSGWDKRQRISRYGDYEVRVASGQASWYVRPTFRGLMATLTVNEGALLQAQDSKLATALGGLPAPGAKEAFLHHVRELAHMVNTVASAADYEAKFRRLDAMYTTASTAWANYARVTGSRNNSDRWIVPLQAGLREYGRSEGWI
jgi:hypothetical protein